MPIGGATGPVGIIVIARRTVALEVLVNHLFAAVSFQYSGIGSIGDWYSDGDGPFITLGWVNFNLVVGVVRARGLWHHVLVPFSVHIIHCRPIELYSLLFGRGFIINCYWRLGCGSGASGRGQRYRLAWGSGPLIVGFIYLGVDGVISG